MKEERFEQLYEENQAAFAQENAKVALLDKPLVEGWDGMAARLLSLPLIVTATNPVTLKRCLTASLNKPVSALKDWLIQALKAQQGTPVSVVADVQAETLASERLEEPVGVVDAPDNGAMHAFIEQVVCKHACSL